MFRTLLDPPLTSPSHRALLSHLLCCSLHTGLPLPLRKLDSCLADLPNTGWPASPGPLSSLKTRNGSPFGPFFGRNGFLWEVREIEISMREPDFEPFSWFEPFPFFGSKNIKVGVCKKSYETPSGSTKQAGCLRHGFYKNVLLTLGKVHFAKMHIFRNFEPLIFCTVLSTICGTVVKKND